MLHKLFRIIVIVSILASLSCQKRLFENASGPNKESVNAIENATATAGIPNTASIEDKIRKYCPHASVSGQQRSEIEDYITLDIAELNTEERIRGLNEANKNNINNKIYSQDYFQIYIPDEMYVIDMPINDGVILKHRNKPAFIYILSPQWHKPSVYLYLDFNYGEFNHMEGFRDFNMTFTEKSIICDYVYPKTKDEYTRYVMIKKSYSGGMSVFVLIYKEPETKLLELRNILNEVLSKFKQFADA